ncbi:HAAS signaling domain-containing protein [Paenibacillus sp. 1P07SE]|uniref:HAAS signaling domain-containing protein n=1 Tax=Paenibacillus sp. 1P07SE TaxID=3132209 RepID=UPI0039A55409
MELVERYIAAVTGRLPHQQRSEIERELRGLIEDMLEERKGGREASESEIEAVLIELGHPRKLADGYRGSPRYLIGPALMDSYMAVLKIVLFTVLSIMSVIFAVEVILEPAETMHHLVEYTLSLLAAGVQGFAWVTVIFAFLEYRGVGAWDVTGKREEDWEPADLPPLTEGKLEIKRSEPIVGIVFSVLILVAVWYSPQWIGIHRFLDGEWLVVPFFDPEKLQVLVYVLLAMFALQLAKDAVKLIFRRWTFKLAGINLLFNLATIGLFILAFQVYEPWNPDFMVGMFEIGLVDLGGDRYDAVSAVWEAVTEYFVLVAIIICIWDAAAAYYKVFSGAASARAKRAT